MKLAIFNSCDGLGLACQLADLDIAQMIVWREPVPDEIAQEFLKSFLHYFTLNLSSWAGETSTKTLDTWLVQELNRAYISLADLHPSKLHTKKASKFISIL